MRGCFPLVTGSVVRISFVLKALKKIVDFLLSHLWRKSNVDAIIPQESRSLYVSVYFDSSRLKRDVANDLVLP